jgi:hypothetical protein
MQNAMEGTVLHVPCIPSKRWRGFWRSSVRGLGPPPTSRSSANGERMPLSGERPASALATVHLAERTPSSNLSRGALRARVRARAQVRVSQFARPAPVARLRRRQTSPPTSLSSRS